MCGFVLANGKDMQRIISTHVEASKIGRQIAEQVMDSQRQGGDSSSGSSPDPDPESSLTVPSGEVSIVYQYSIFITYNDHLLTYCLGVQNFIFLIYNSKTPTDRYKSHKMQVGGYQKGCLLEATTTSILKTICYLALLV